MNSDFGYSSKKPFKEIDKDKLAYSIIDINEKGIALKTDDISMFDTLECFSNKFIESKTTFCVDSNYHAITMFNTKMCSTTYSGISTTTLSSNMYVVSKDVKDTVNHFQDSTHIKEINYYHDDLINIFKNSSITTKNKVKKNKLETFTLEAKKQDKIVLGKVILDKHNEITIELINGFSYVGNFREITVKGKTFIHLRFKNYIDFNMAYKISKRLDSVIHILSLSEKRCITMDFFNTNREIYTYKNEKYRNDDKKDKNFLLVDKLVMDNTFEKLFQLMVNVSNDNSNAFFPFFNYDREKTHMEIQFLEYYKVLEYIHTEKQKKIGKGKNNLFMAEYLKKYPNLKNNFFGSQDNKNIEEEIRSLRNYYSHTGYYLKVLPIPTANPRRYKNITIEDIYSFKNFIKNIAYLEICSLAGVNINETVFLNYI
ncbi:MAG: hypothetical protein RSE57_03635 [Clostridia bacterium]